VTQVAAWGCAIRRGRARDAHGVAALGDLEFDPVVWVAAHVRDDVGHELAGDQRRVAGEPAEMVEITDRPADRRRSGAITSHLGPHQCHAVLEHNDGYPETLPEKRASVRTR
jgi:hypothetical protein